MAKKRVKADEKSSRRGNSEGTIYQKSDGRWCAQVSLGSRGGKRVRRTITGRIGESKQDVLDQLHKLLQQQATATLAEPSKLTLREFLEHWLELGAGASVTASTLASYRRNLQRHVFPSLGHIRAQQITPLHVQSVLSRMKIFRRDGNKTWGATPLPSSERSKQYLFSILKRAFSRGIQWGIIVRNPCDGCERPKSGKFEISPLNEEQVHQFLEAAKESPVYGFFALAVQTGARQGELRALRWSDVNLNSRTLSIRRTVSEGDAGEIEKAPKTAKGVRHINLVDASVNILAELRKNALAAHGWSKSARLFHRGDGELIDRMWLSREFSRILKRANLPAIRFHDLRHTHATLLLLQGVHAKIVQERLGHATIAVTIDTYSHVLPSMQDQVVEKLNKLFG